MTGDESVRRGPHHPATSTPVLMPGGVRRTTTIDAVLPTGPGERLELALAGRDLVLERDGSRQEVHQSVGMSLDYATRRVEAVTSVPRRTIDDLLGLIVGPGFRKQLAPVLEPEMPTTLLHSLLDQLPGAAFLVGYPRMVDDPPVADSSAIRARFAGRVGLCAGYTKTGTIATWVREAGRHPVPRGPQAPDLRFPEPDGWHDLPPLPPLSFRRARRIDVGPVRAGGVVEVDAMFRDVSVARDRGETVLHEYSVRVHVDVARGLVVRAEAQPRVLPWQECPAAAGSVARVVGVPIADLRRWVTANLSGETTCTHLNEALRVLADVAYLLNTVGRAGNPLRARRGDTGR